VTQRIKIINETAWRDTSHCSKTCSKILHAYRAVAIMSRKQVTKYFRVAKKYCAQWQLKGSRCLTHNLCAIFIGFTQHDNCAIAIANIIKSLSSKLLSFLSSLYNRPLFCHPDAEDNGDNQEKAERCTADLR